MKTDLSTRLGLLLALVGLFCGCQTFTAVAPSGFAPYDESDPFRAVSSDGVVFQVRSEKNEPKADLNFWKEAMKTRMSHAGYVFVQERDIKAGKHTGYYLELAAPVGQEDYAYGIGLFVTEGDIVLTESAGKVLSYQKHRQAILEAIRNLKLETNENQSG